MLRKGKQRETAKMKGLSVKQPWASLIVDGIKDVENRSRYTQYRGPLLIHASKVHDAVPLAETLPAGAIIGQVNLVDCCKRSASPWAEMGKYHWVLSDARPFDKPVPYPGRLGLFDAPDPDAQHLFKPHDGRTRRVCITEEPCDVMITRPGKWGNPWRAVCEGKKFGQDWCVRHNNNGAFLGCFDFKESAIYWAVKGYSLHLQEHLELIEAAKTELKGLRLGCFCKLDEPCHGDVLVRMVEEMG